MVENKTSNGYKKKINLLRLLKELP